MTDKETLEQAKQLLSANTQHYAAAGRTYRCTVPSRTHYPFQWLWDSAFHAIVWSEVDVPRARDELSGLFLHQARNGFIPHVVFWNQDRVSRFNFHYVESKVTIPDLILGRKPRTTGQSQPPVLAQAVEAASRGEGGETYISSVLPSLALFYRYWANERDADGDGLISTISQFETGLDYSPAYDRVIGCNPRRPSSIFLRSRRVEWQNRRAGYDARRILADGRVHVADVLMNSLYIDGLRALARLADRRAQRDTASWARLQAERTATALLERCFDYERGIFFNLADGRQQSHVETIQGLMPLLLDDLPRSVIDRLLETLTDPSRFWTRWPVPSVAANAPEFLHDNHLYGFRFIWRGALSMNTNWFLHRALLTHGESGLAAELRAKSRDLVARHGFNEFYSPLTGEPVGEQDFGWATLAAVM